MFLYACVGGEGSGRGGGEGAGRGGSEGAGRGGGEGAGRGDGEVLEGEMMRVLEKTPGTCIKTKTKQKTCMAFSLLLRKGCSLVLGPVVHWY